MINLGSIGGTRLHMDNGFLILVVFFIAANYNAAQGIQYALLWVPVIFVSVLLHELAHAALIALFGHGASTIVLGGMGGVTINERRGKPWQEALISVAGPLASFGLAWLTARGFENIAFVQHDPMLSALFPRLYQANIFWGIFNLIPISPLDGGHAVRNFLRMIVKEPRAFVIAVWIGMITGVAAAIYGALQGQIFLAMFMAWFVFANFQQWQAFRERGTPGD